MRAQSTHAGEREVFVIAGEGGVGKSRLINLLLARYPEFLTYAKSTTTRERRTDKRAAYDAFAYEFLDEGKAEEERKAHFEFQMSSGAFIQLGTKHLCAGQYYGTRISVLKEIFDRGAFPICDLKEDTIQFWRRAHYNLVVFRLIPDGWAPEEKTPKSAARIAEDELRKKLDLGPCIDVYKKYDADPNVYDPVALRLITDEIDRRIGVDSRLVAVG